MSDLLESGQSGLVVVAVNPQGTDVGALMANAVDKIAEDGVVDTDDAVEAAFENAEA